MSGYDPLLEQIADYVESYVVASEEAYATARLCLLDSLGCALLALRFPACTRVLGHTCPEDPLKAAFHLSGRIRWLDYNDTWLAKEWGHPSDNLGGLLAAAPKEMRVRELLEAMIKAYEIQGVLALGNSFNQLGFDHVILVKVATAAVATKLLGGTRDHVLAALSQAFADGVVLRCYRHAPHTGSRKSWAAADATSRGLFLAQLSLKGEMGYPRVLSTPTWGFSDALLRGQSLLLEQPLTEYVIENILFKVKFPAEFHAQTAVECAAGLHPHVKDRLQDIERIEINTHASALRIIDKTGPLKNPADRDHCLQYMVAVALLTGSLEAEHYEETFASHPLLDKLRHKMRVTEEVQFSRDYLDPQKRSIANRVTLYFKGDSTPLSLIEEYPLGHRRRRAEATPLLLEKFRKNASSIWSKEQVEEGIALFRDVSRLEELTISQLRSLWE